MADPQGNGGSPGFAPGVVYVGSSGGTQDGGSSGAGAGGGGPELLEVSLICGDGVRDSDTEECDDGIGDEADLCTNRCQVADTAVVPLPAVAPAAADLKGRYLGQGRHPIAASEHALGVVFVEPDSEPPVVGLSVFDPAGDPRQRIDVGDGADPVLFANPVVAALSDGSFAAAWTNFGDDGDELGVAFRRVTPAPVPNGGAEQPEVGAPLGSTLSPVQFANAETAFSQFDADMIAVGSSLVVAWTDTTNPETAPDIRYRTFSTTGMAGSEFSATSSDLILSDDDDYEGSVALAGPLLLASHVLELHESAHV